MTEETLRGRRVIAGVLADGGWLWVAVLPCYLGDPDPRLTRLSDIIPDMETNLWALTHQDLRRTARVRALLDFVADAIKRQRDVLTGTT